MQKVMMVCESFGGGVFAYVSQLCNDLCDDFEIYLVYSVRPQTPIDYRRKLHDKVTMIELPELGDLGSPLRICAAIKRLRELDASISPDVIHLHSSIAGGIGRIALCGHSRGRVVYTPHGYAFMLLGGGVKSVVYHCLEKALGRCEAVTLTCCESEDKVARSLTRYSTFIETGVDVAKLEKLVDDVKPSNHDRFTVFTLGRICEQKQPELFNEIAGLVPEADFLWVGDGELRDKLTSPNVRVTGWKSREEALAIAKGADAFVLCSKGEAIAMSLLENMLLKKLVLVSDVMGNSSVVSSGVNGYTCVFAEDYARAIRQAMETFPNGLVDRAYEDVLSIYNTKTMKMKYLRFYSVLAKDGVRRFTNV